MNFEVREVADGVTRVVAPNDSPKTLQGTNCYLVDRRLKLLIDPGPLIPSYLLRLSGYVRSHSGIDAVLLTHGHPDHAEGAWFLAQYLNVPVWTSSFGSLPDIKGTVPKVRHLEHGERVELDGGGLEVVYSPGHTPDHLCFFLRPDQILFSGDVILGEGTTLIAPPEGNMIEYMKTLDRLEELEPRVILPGHGPPVAEGAARIRSYRDHRLAREAQLLEALSAETLTVPQLVKRIYGDTEGEVTDLAALSLQAQIAKLETERLISREGSSYRASSRRPRG